MAVLQFQKLSPSDEGRQRQAALLAFFAFSELKHVFIVDEDVDCFDINDVLWAMNTRFQGMRTSSPYRESDVIRWIPPMTRPVRQVSGTMALPARRFLTARFPMTRRNGL